MASLSGLVWGQEVARIGAVEDAEDGFFLQSHFRHVNHAAPVFGAVVLFWKVMTDVFQFDFKAAETGAVHASIQDTGHSQNAVTNRFSF